MITNTTKNKKTEWLFGGNPTAIEKQEEDGQQELVNSSQLPVKSESVGDVLDIYKELEFEVLNNDDDDDLFVNVKLPDNWRIESTDHSMWSNLIDDKDRIRASIFYKAAFYDRDAFIVFKQRFDYAVNRIGFLNENYDQDENGYIGYRTPFKGIVTDNGDIVFETQEMECNITYNEPDGRGGYTQEYKRNSRNIEETLTNKCLGWLNKNKPNYKNVVKYWDEI